MSCISQESYLTPGWKIKSVYTLIAAVFDVFHSHSDLKNENLHNRVRISSENCGCFQNWLKVGQLFFDLFLLGESWGKKKKKKHHDQQ